MRILFRTNAGSEIGTGHVMRCLALAQAVQRRGGHAVFLAATLPEEIARRLRGEQCEIRTLRSTAFGEEDAAETADRAKELGVEWIVVDGYGFDARYQTLLKEHGARVLFVDDYGHCDHYGADIVLNQNVSAREEWYAARGRNTRLLLGTAYVLLRREFLESTSRRSTPPRAGKILVTLGGGDPDNVTGKVLRAIGRLAMPDLRVTVIIGGSNPHRAELERMVGALGASARSFVNTTRMPELMAEADVAIAAGGTTSYELAFLGLPSLCLILADNQRGIARRMDEEGVMQLLGWHAEVSEEEIADALGALLNDVARRLDMCEKGRALVDGGGAGRVLKVLLDGLHSSR